MPLTVEQVEPGQRVKSPDGDEYDINDAFAGQSGNRWLLLTTPDGPDDVSVWDAGRVRSEWEAVDPAQVAEDRQQRAQDAENGGNTVADHETGNRRF